MVATEPNHRTPRLFYGWILMLVLMLLVSIGMGTTMYMYSLVAGAVGEEFGASRLMLMAGSTGMLLVMGLCSPALGRALDRYSCKWILTVGALVMGMGFLWVAFSTHVWMMVASYVLLISIGAATLSLLTTATLLTRWFVRHRGLAIGIAALGTQFGGFFYPPLFAATMEAHDWRFAVAGMGVLIMVASPLLIWLFEVDHPQHKGLVPLGGAAPATDSHRQQQAAVRLSFSQLLKHRNFWLVVLIAGVGMATNTTLLANLSLFATDLGEPVVRGAFLVSLVALLGVFASPFLGWLSDVINLKVVAGIMILALTLACFMFSIADSYGLLLTAALFMGIGGGGVYPVFASLVAHLYDQRVYGQVLGTSTLLTSVITAASPLFAGWIHDVTGSYRLLFITLMAILLVVMVCISLLRIPGASREKFGAGGGELGTAA